MESEYHSICWAVSGNINAIELVKGSDGPPLRAPKQFSENVKATDLLLGLTESFQHSGKVVNMGSGFCVHRYLVKLASVVIINQSSQSDGSTG
jgi:hypothetical protein